MIKKESLVIPIICIAVLLSVAACWISGEIILDYGRYFAVNNTGRVYLGVDQFIHIYEDSFLVKRFLVGRGVRFTVSGNELITFDGTDSFRYTLDGEEIGRGNVEHNAVFTQYRYISDDGTEYRIYYPWGRFSVRNQKSGELVFQMPLRDYLFGIAGIVSMCILACWGCFASFKLLARQV